MQQSELSTLIGSLLAAAEARDWRQLSQLDAQLSAYLHSGRLLDELARQALRDAYRAALLACRVESLTLERRLQTLDHERSGQQAYAANSDWGTT